MTTLSQYKYIFFQGPLFFYPLNEAFTPLNKNDAKFVDVIHTGECWIDYAIDYIVNIIII